MVNYAIGGLAPRKVHSSLCSRLGKPQNWTDAAVNGIHCHAPKFESRLVPLCGLITV
jgi:hypothetical protein